MPLDFAPQHPVLSPAEQIRKRFADVLRNCPYPKCQGTFGSRRPGEKEPYEVCAIGAIALGMGQALCSTLSHSSLLYPDLNFWEEARQAEINLGALAIMNNETEATFAELADRLERGDFNLY